MTNRWNRRQFFEFPATGLATAAFLSLAHRESMGHGSNDRIHGPHFAPRAKRAIHICLIGGFSQVDSFDYKPALFQLHGKPIPGGTKPETFFGSAGLLSAPHWKFRQRGKSGLWVSDLFPHIAQQADALAVVRSMVADSANHTPAFLQQMTGFPMNGFPSLGSWLSYGLGSESDSLPTFVVLPDARSLPNGGASNWGTGFLPAEHQGVWLRGGDEPILDLFPRRGIAPKTEQASRDLLAMLNARHLETRQDNDMLGARLKSYELAARMQVSIPEAVNLDDETEATLTSYGVGSPQTDDCGKRCLLARRLIERGVRFVQIFSGGCFGGNPRHGWDSHEDCKTDHEREAALIDRPIAALLADLRQRGLLDETLVLFTTEFGRTPFANSPEGVAGLGRDHNPEGFTVWLAGGGVRGGLAYGQTDEIGWKATENPVTWPDLHATILHLLGLDHQRLTFYHNGIDRRLTNVHGQVIQPLLA